MVAVGVGKRALEGVARVAASCAESADVNWRIYARKRASTCFHSS